MFCTDLKFSSSFYLAVFMKQLTTLSVEHGDPDLAASSLAALKSELVEEKATRVKARAGA
jgi:hypothetical protein